RAEALHGRRSRSHPEGRLSDTELCDDVVAVAHTMNDGCAKSGLVEGHRFAGVFDPQLGLHARHHGLPLEYGDTDARDLLVQPFPDGCAGLAGLRRWPIKDQVVCGAAAMMFRRAATCPA